MVVVRFCIFYAAVLFIGPEFIYAGPTLPGFCRDFCTCQASATIAAEVSVLNNNVPLDILALSFRNAISAHRYRLITRADIQGRHEDTERIATELSQRLVADRENFPEGDTVMFVAEWGRGLVEDQMPLMGTFYPPEDGPQGFVEIFNTQLNGDVRNHTSRQRNLPYYPEAGQRPAAETDLEDDADFSR